MSGNRAVPRWAREAEPCDGCQMKTIESPTDCWCYMFQHKPATLPCAQHDKFSVERKAVGAAVTAHPYLVALALVGVKT